MRNGFTLVEVMVAGAVLAIGAIGVLGMLVTAIDNNRESKEHALAVTVAEMNVETLRSYASPSLAAAEAGGNTGTTLNPAVTLHTRGVNVWTNPFSSDNAARVVDEFNVSKADGKFRVGMMRLDETEMPGVMRAAVRVVWGNNGNLAECPGIDKFNELDVRTTRNNYLKCSFVTMPFFIE